ncbi:LPS export ABC transporter periplasmic protein LptC [Candidatus Pelagibacter sp.]|nr:LPS export ABC transporter periplasmic protein LptC [Candidatus Pelagibacter sp.]
MNKKIVIQLLLFFIIFLLIALLIFKYSIKKNIKSSVDQKITISSNSNKESFNTIENIEYNSNDSLGNQYIIKARYGKILAKNKNIILMQDVQAEINFNKYEKIMINASSATYNIINYDTNFKNDIRINYDENIITSDNMDLLFQDHKIKIYNNIRYNYLNTDLVADGMEIDFLTKNSKIYMIDQDKKIKVIYKNNVNN